MKKILVCSDLHLDVNEFALGMNMETEVEQFVKRKQPDVVLIAGDVSDHYEDTMYFVDKLTENTSIPFYFIPGNHDVWSTKEKGSFKNLEILKKHPLCLLEKELKINEYHIIGEFGWYDYSFGENKHVFGDFEKNRNTYWDGSVTRLHKNDRAFFQEQYKRIHKKLQKHQHDPMIVLQHFVPFQEFLTKRDEKWNYCNAYMGSKRLGELFASYKNIEYIIFGHTHQRWGEKIIKGKKVLCNPLGYVKEWETKNPQEELEKASYMIHI